MRSTFLIDNFSGASIRVHHYVHEKRELIEKLSEQNFAQFLVSKTNLSF